MSYFTALKCRECGQDYPVQPLHVCETCFGPLEVVYDYARIRGAVSRKIIETHHGKLEIVPPQTGQHGTVRVLLPIESGTTAQ